MKKSIILGLLMLFSTVMAAQSEKYQLSSHILDVSKGTPASGVTIKLEKLDEKTNNWIKVDEKVTDKNGRITNFLKGNTSNLGIYKLTYLQRSILKEVKSRVFTLL